jgi:hypothetical protein
LLSAARPGNLRVPPFAGKRIMPVRLDRISSRTGLVA